MKLPMREKYVDEAIKGPLFIFGIHHGGGVDVVNNSGDVLENIPVHIAEAVCLAHDEFRQKLYALLCREG